ncbi:MAG: hypothetical protein M3268_09715 [Acidobacteriota bacterium]|nr:hypothetical protein [Acidobacteriota bacterium]
MKVRLFLMMMFAAAVAFAPPQSSAKLGVARAAVRDFDQDKSRRDRDDDDSSFTERDEFRQSYTLAPGAQVRVAGINGSVDVETSTSGAAEVQVVRTARSRSDLDYHKVIVEQTASGLVVRGENNRDRDGVRDGDNHQVRQRVWLRIPRSVEFTASGINGRATVGEIDGPVHLSGINGKCEVGQARGYTDISGINGSVSMTITQLSERGIRVSGVNGHVELHFDGALNADLSVSGINGAVNADVPNVTVQGRVSRTSFEAKIGAGGAPITVSGVNGSVRLAPRS